MASLVAINLNKYAAQNVPLMLPHNHRPTEPHLLKVRRPIAVCFDTCVCQVGVGGCTDGCTDGWALQVYTRWVVSRAGTATATAGSSLHIAALFVCSAVSRRSAEAATATAAALVFARSD